MFEAQAVDASNAQGVRVKQVVEDGAPPKMVYDPKHPMADDKGYVAMPNVSVVDEMVNMLSASRSYQTNVETMNAAKTFVVENFNHRAIISLFRKKDKIMALQTNVISQ